MTEIRCPNCSFMNPLSALTCRECGLPFSNLPASAFVSTKTDEPAYEMPGFPPHAPIEPYQPITPVGSTTFAADDYELGRKTFFWYRVYLAFMVVLYMFVAVGGAALAYFQPSGVDSSPEEMLLTGVIYGILGALFFIVYLVALVLPARSYNWIVGLVMIAIGMTSCCLWPAVIPLLIFWIKPETRKFFGRN